MNNKCWFIRGRKCSQPKEISLGCEHLNLPCFPTEQDFINEYPDRQPEAVKAWLANGMKHQISMYEKYERSNK